MNHLIYLVSRIAGGHRLTRYLARDHPRIFMYHRISEDAQGSGIDQESLRYQMRLIRQHFNPMPLSDLVSSYTCGEATPHAVAVTFDDGYMDFYEYALPVLKEEGIPATVFVSTGFIDGDIWLWPDKLRYCFEHTSEPKLEILGVELPLNTNNERFKAWDLIADYCLLIGNEEKNDLIMTVANLLNIVLPTIPPKRYAGMTWSQVREAVSEGIDVGSHSVTHPRLTSLSKQELFEEVKTSKTRIEEEIGQKVNAFCYPNGQPSDFNDTTKMAIRHAGYDYALAAYPGPNPLGDRWSIKRYSASDSPAIFERMLFGFTYLGMIASQDKQSR